MQVSDILKEYEKGCSCTIDGKPSSCEACLDAAVRAINMRVGMQWNDNMDEAPRDGTEVLLHYRNFLGTRDLVVSGHWDGHGDDINDTWEHSLGYGDPTHWMPLPEPPK